MWARVESICGLGLEAYLAGVGSILGLGLETCGLEAYVG